MLPALLVHGDLVWKGCLVAFVALVFLVVARVRRSRARGWARSVSAALDLHSDRVVRGTLGGGTARSRSTGDDHHDHRDADLWIATPDGRIPLVGSIRVLAGTATTAEEGHVVGIGDEVIAHGALERRPGVADYRSDATTFALVGAPITLSARTPAVVVPRLAAVSIALIAATSLSIGYIAERALGAGWRGACASGHADACELAATMPGGASAGRLLLAVLDFEHHNNRAEVDHRVAVAELVGDCEYAMRPLEQAQLWDELLVMARRCNSPVEQQLALAELGRFAEAVTFAPTTPKLPRLQLLIMAHEWIAAGDELERTGHVHPPRTRRQDVMCRADLLRAWGGETSALVRTRTLGHDLAEAQVYYGWPCELETRALDRSIDTWYELGTPYGDAQASEVYAAFAALDDSAVAAWGSRFWTWRFAHHNMSAAPYQLAVDDAAAIHRAMTGDLEGAYRDAVEIDERVEQMAYYDPKKVRVPLTRQLLLYTQSTAIPHDLPDATEERHDAWAHQLAHVLLRDGLPYPTHLDRRTGQALDIAQMLGDGAPLAARLAESHQLRDLDLIAVLPRVTRGRAALVDAVRWMVPDNDPLGAYGFPYVPATRAFTRRSVLDLAGDHGAAERWADIFRRYDAALADEHTLVALALASAT
ncbi:MAG: hypothetical protein ABJE66_06595 [Deltaproteobacteria bacterium]